MITDPGCEIALALEGRVQVWWIQYGLTWQIVAQCDEVSVALLAVEIEGALDLLAERRVG